MKKSLMYFLFAAASAILGLWLIMAVMTAELGTRYNHEWILWIAILILVAGGGGFSVLGILALGREETE